MARSGTSGGDETSGGETSGDSGRGGASKRGSPSAVSAQRGRLAETGLVRAARYLQPGVATPDAREMHRRGGRRAEEFYRERWRHDKVVRSTHGVNCTGSCSWRVYVKDGIITWETQAVDYPSVGSGSPEYEPRGCPRGASFSWYTYSPAPVRYPYVRGVLLELYRHAKAANGGDPVAGWAELVNDPERARAYKSARGRGGFVRAGWSEVLEMVAAAHVHTVAAYGPDRTVAFTVIPAMSMASYAAGTRFYSLLGGTILSFYDWYADLPPASPQVFGDQTDVPESADWWNATYLMVWGTNLPITRTPDAHFMTEARYRGQKVVVVSPDFSDHTKFADDWLAANPGTDGALAMAMGHVMLCEFYRDRPGLRLHLVEIRVCAPPTRRGCGASHAHGRPRLRWRKCSSRTKRLASTSSSREMCVAEGRSTSSCCLPVRSSASDMRNAFATTTLSSAIPWIMRSGRLSTAAS